MKLKVGVARDKATKRWHIIVVRENDPSGRAHIHDDLIFDTEAEAKAELDRQIKLLGPPYTIEWMQ